MEYIKAILYEIIKGIYVSTKRKNIFIKIVSVCLITITTLLISFIIYITTVILLSSSKIIIEVRYWYIELFVVLSFALIYTINWNKGESILPKKILVYIFLHKKNKENKMPIIQKVIIGFIAIALFFLITNLFDKINLSLSIDINVISVETIFLLALFYGMFSESACDKILHYKMQFFVGLVGEIMVIILYFYEQENIELVSNQYDGISLFNFAIGVAIAASVSINGYRSWYDELEEKYEEEIKEYLKRVDTDNIINGIGNEMEKSKRDFIVFKNSWNKLTKKIKIKVIVELFILVVIFVLFLIIISTLKTQ